MENKKTRIIFRADGNSGIGLGHVYRLVSLIARLDASFEKRFVLQKTSSAVYGLLAPLVSHILEIAEDADFETEESSWISALTGEEIVVLDGYRFDGRYQKAIKQKGSFLFMPDDIHAFHYYADIIVNVGTDRPEPLYPHTEFYTRVYGGFPYAFLRPAFDAEARRTLAGDAVPKTGILICLGGADPDNRVEEVYRQTRSLYAHETLHVVVGSAYVHAERLRQNLPHDPLLAIHQNLDENALAKLMASCHTGICSASTVSYEFLCTGGRLFLFRTADNQKHIYEYLIRRGLAFPFGDLARQDAEAVPSPVLPQLLEQYLQNDYNRLFRTIAEQKTYRLRKAVPEDASTIFGWVNEPETRKQSLRQEPIAWEDHLAWYTRKLASPGSYLFILQKNETPVGQIRFDELENSDETLISFLVDHRYRGLGLGSLILSYGVQRYRLCINGERTVTGFVKMQNPASLKAFRKNRFAEITVLENGEEMVKFLLPPANDII